MTTLCDNPNMACIFKITIMHVQCKTMQRHHYLMVKTKNKKQNFMLSSYGTLIRKSVGSNVFKWPWVT